MERALKLSNGLDNVIIKKGLLLEITDFLPKNQKVLLVSDDGIPSIYYEKIKTKYPEIMVHIVSQGEKSKSIKTYQEILNILLENHFSRDDYILALGGGVVTDLVGFVAATFKRGIKFISIPTSLLAMVDAAIGGKNGLNFNGIKNMIGTFYHPVIVLVDPNVLSTLPKRQFNNGLVEAIKIGLIKDRKILEIIKEDDYYENIEEVIYRSISVKMEIVKQDEKENQTRKLLNFGHTFGHAYEEYFKMNDILHGEAVGLGMLTVCKHEKYYQSLYNLLKKLDLPLEVVCDKKQIIEFIKNDKKANSYYIDLVVVHEIGNGIIERVKIENLDKYME